MKLRSSICFFFLVALLVPFSGAPARSQPMPASGPAGEQRAPHVREAGTQAAPAGKPALVSTSALTRTAYLPLMMRPLAIDLSIDSLEVTQSVQNTIGDVPLVAGRATVVRVYAKVTGGLSPSNISLLLSGTRGGAPLPSVTVAPQAVSTTPARAVYDSSFNVELPEEWLSGDVSLVATIDSTNALDEANESNNTASATLNFTIVPPLDIKIVPIQYTHAPNGQMYPAPTLDTLSSWIRRTFPVSTVDVLFRAPVSFVGDLKNTDGSSWIALINLVAQIKQSDGAPASQVYYGFVSTSNGTSDWLGNGGIVGIGATTVRVSVGLDLPIRFGPEATSQVAAHEIGHNFMRLHAPCKASDGLDPAYPYAAGSIGQYGLDINTLDVSQSILWTPSTAAPDTDPNGAVDVMSYCKPAWISDYTYKALHANQMLNGLLATSAAPADGLLIKATFGGDGVPVFGPAYAISTALTQPPASSDYTVELLDAAGAVIAAQPVLVNEIEQPHIYEAVNGRMVGREAALDIRGMATKGPSRSIVAVVPRPSRPVASIRLVHAGVVVATRALNPAAPSAGRPALAAVDRVDGAAVLRWSAPAVPVLVRYTADDGTSWTTLGMDVLGGALRVDLATLPGGGAGRFEITPAE